MNGFWDTFMLQICLFHSKNIGVMWRLYDWVSFYSKLIDLFSGCMIAHACTIISMSVFHGEWALGSEWAFSSDWVSELFGEHEWAFWSEWTLWSEWAVGIEWVSVLFGVNEWVSFVEWMGFLEWTSEWAFWSDLTDVWADTTCSSIVNAGCDRAFLLVTYASNGFN